MAAFLFSLGSPITAEAAAPERLTQFCPMGIDAGECNNPRGVAVDQQTGDIYVANQSNFRVDRFTAWGEFLLAWGRGVRTGTDAFETCGPAAVPPAPCQPGISSTKSGGVVRTQSLAVDSQGNVYAFDRSALRMQKFSPAGAFLFAVGGEVNKTTNANICTQASGNTCGAGVAGTAPGFFSVVFGSGDVIEAGPGDQVYVGDEERIQVFDSSGSYVKSIPLPGEAPQSLALDSTGNLYLVYEAPDKNFELFSQPNVRKVSPAGAELCAMQVPNPRVVAVSGAGTVYVINTEAVGKERSGVLEFDSSSCARIDTGASEPGFGSDELRTSTGIATSEACDIPGTDVIVSNLATFLQPATFVNAYGPAPDISVCPPPEVAPEIAAQFATAVDTSGATLKATINPKFWPDTRFYVEYGTGECAAGECAQTKPVPPGALLTPNTVNAVITTPGVFLGSLAPDTTYHYRFVAESSGGGPVFGVGSEPGSGESPEASFAEGAEGTFHTFPPRPAPKTDCANQVFRVGFSVSLPDCRAYEMVSPVDKNNGDISVAEASVAMSSALGGRATFSSYRAFGQPEGAPYSNQYFSERTTAGWLSRSISAPREALSMYPTGSPGASTLFKAFSPDLCSAWMVQDNKIDLSAEKIAPPDVPNLYRRHNCPGLTQNSYTLLSTEVPPGYSYEPVESDYYPEPQGYSADGTRTFFRATAKLTFNACAQKELYQVYAQIEGQALELVSVRPNGAANCTHSALGTAQSRLQGELRRDSIHNAVSDDGTRVFWTASTKSDPPSEVGVGDEPGAIFLRANVGSPAVTGEGCLGSTEVACTIKVSELVSSAPARFLTADTAGKVGIFSIGQSLYRFEAEPTPQVSEVAKGFLGLMGASDDANLLYFVSTEALTGSQENSQGDVAVAGKPNLYLGEAGGATTFIGVLGAVDVASIEAISNFPSLIATRPDRRLSRVSPDGEHAAFVSTAPLTGFDNTDATSTRPDAEVFLYDAAAGGAGELSCVSCNQSGVRPAGRQIASDANGSIQLWAAARIPGWTEQIDPTRLLSEDGDRLYFESFEALVTRDTNGAQDVYQWERAASRQQCEEEQGGELFSPESGGCLSLISSGESPEPSYIFDASAAGGDVLFATSASLLPQDPGLIDVYDARVGGGFPPPPPSPEICQGNSCQTPPPPPPDPTPASSGNYPGNVKPVKKCPKGKHKEKRKGKVVCVKNKKKGAGKQGSKGGKR